MLLHEILNSIPVTQFVGSAEQLEIDNISIDSRNCKNGTIFFALKGFKTDGHKFIPQAISSGASAVVMDEDQTGIDQLLSSSKVAKILVKNSREALAQIANVFYGNPSSKLNLGKSPQQI